MKVPFEASIPHRLCVLRGKIHSSLAPTKELLQGISFSRRRMIVSSRMIKRVTFSFSFKNLLIDAGNLFQKDIQKEIHDSVGTTVSTSSLHTCKNKGNSSFDNNRLIAADT